MKDAITSGRDSVVTDGPDIADDGRGADLSAQRGMKGKLDKLYSTVIQGYIDKKERNECTLRYWRIFNCELTTNQAYSGNSQIYLPIVRDCIEARVQRFVNTLFPENGRHVDITAYPADFPRAVVGLLDHYVRRAELRDKARQLLRNGEVEGQFSFYVDWTKTTRYITKKVEKHPEIDDGVYDPDDKFFDVEDEEVVSEFPNVHIINDNDLCVLPATTESIEHDADVIVARRLFFTEEGLRNAGRDGLFSNKAALPDAIAQIQSFDPANIRDTRKDNSESAGVRLKANKPEYVVFEVWKKFRIKRKGDKKAKLRWCRIFFGGENICLGMTVNPNWNDRCPIISKARNKIDGTFWGKSPVDAVEQLQYMANDWINMAQDSGQYSLLPIVMTDPEKNPNYASMVLSLAAVWQTSPNDTKFVEFPQLWKDAIQFVAEARSQIVQAFGLNPSMISMGFLARQQTQAAIAQESLVAIANITDEVLTLEDSLFTPMLQFFFELDQQFRDEPLTIKVYGQPGIEAQMQKVPAFAWDDRYEFVWRGAQVAKSQQQNQQMIAGINVLRQFPVLPDGKQVDFGPILEAVVENIYGPRLGSRILIDKRDQLTIPQELENDIMAGGVGAPVHPMDNDAEHIQKTQMAIQQTGDPTGLLRVHLQAHMAQMQQKQMQMMQQAMAQQGGGGPRPGAQPQAPRGGQNPAGAIHKDQMQDPTQQPRKAEGSTGTTMM